MQDTDRIRKLENDHVGLAQRVTHLENQDAAQWDQMRRYEEQHGTALNELKDQNRRDYENLLNAIHANKIAWSSMSTGTKVMAWFIFSAITLGGVVATFFTGIKRFFTGG